MAQMYTIIFFYEKKFVCYNVRLYICSMEHGHTNGQTFEQLCEQYAKNIDSVRVQYGRKGWAGWSRTNVPTSEQYAVLFGGERKNTKRPTVRAFKNHVHNDSTEAAAAFTTVEAAPLLNEPKPAINWRGIAFDIVAVGIVIAHAGLIWFDCVQLWGLPGGIAGGIAFMVVLLTLLVSSDPSRGRTSGNALVFAGIIDVCAWWVHYPAFKHYAAAPDWLTGCICAVVCAASFAALYLFRDIKID
jgi:hypothetical protein